MIVRGIEIDWFHGFTNDPRLIIVADDIPKFKDGDPIYHRSPIDPNLIFATKEGLVDYILMGEENSNQPSKLRGFAGRRFTRTLVDGTVLTSNNCWSSRASCLPINVIEGVVRETENKYGLLSTGIDALFAQQLVEPFGYYIIPKYSKSGETMWILSTSPSEPKKIEDTEISQSVHWLD